GGVELTVISSVREEHPEGIAVYNFEVEGDHTYFVEDGHGTQLWAWVHNDCSADAQALRAAFEAAGKKASQGDQAAHLVPGRISSSNPIVQTALDNMRDVLSRLGIGHNSKWNG